MTRRRKGSGLESLARLVQVVTASLELPEVLDSVVRAATDLVPDSASRIWVVEEDRLVLRSEAGTRSPRRSGRKTELAFGEGLAGHVAVTRRPLVLEDVVADSRTLNVEWMRQETYVSCVGLPLLVWDRLVGVLFLFTRHRHRFSAEEVELLTSFGTQAAIAIENARLYREAREHGERLRALDEVNRRVSSSLRMEEVVENIATAASRFFEAPQVHVWVMDPSVQRLRRRVTVGDSEAAGGLAQELAVGEGGVGWVAQHREPILWTDLMWDRRIQARPWALEHGLRYFTAYPIMLGDRVVGAIAMYRRAPYLVTRETTSLLGSLAAQAAVALDNARLYAEAQEQLRETEALLSASRALSSTFDLETLLRHFLRQVARTLEADSVGVWMVDPASGKIEPVVGYHVPPHLLESLRSLRLDPEASVFYAEGIASQRVQFSDSVPADPRIPENLKAIAPHQAQLFAPIVAKGRVVGAFIAVWWTRARQFSERELALLEAMGNQAGVAVENARLFQENRRKLEELSVLYEVCHAVTGQLEVVQLAETIYRQVGRVLDAQNMVIFRYDAGHKEFDIVLRMLDGEPDQNPNRRHPWGRGLMSRVVERCQPIRTSNYTETCRLEGVEPTPASLRFPYWLGVPMIAADEPVGGLALRSTVRPFTEDDERLLSNIASLVALAFRSALLFEEKTRAYSELATAQDQLIRTEKLRALGEMASGVAHDFNNLLASILGRTQLVLKRVEDPTLRRWLQVVERAALDGAHTVQRIQEFTRIRRDQPFVTVDLNQVVQQALEVTQPRWRGESQGRGTPIQVVTSLARLPAVAGDPAELREALTNLILNALDAMPAGGTLSLMTRTVGERVVVTVSDTGIGMSPEVRHRLFDPFFTTKGPQGTGLGLSMTYGIVSRHGGEIAVQSAEGNGSTFELSFPVGPALPREGEAAGAPAGAASLRCLVVDDEPVVREVLGDLLRQGGHEVVLMADGTEAVVRFKAEPFDLVLTDLAMPGLNGLQVARAIKDHDPGVPVFIVTGWGTEYSPEQLRAHGVDRVLPKPLKFDDILAAVAAVRPRSGSQEDSP